MQLTLDGVLYIRVIDPYKVCIRNSYFSINSNYLNLKASYGVDDPEFAVRQLAQTTMRSEVGKINLDTVFKEREHLNISIVG